MVQLQAILAAVVLASLGLLAASYVIGDKTDYATAQLLRSAVDYARTTAATNGATLTLSTSAGDTVATVADSAGNQRVIDLKGSVTFGGLSAVQFSIQPNGDASYPALGPAARPVFAVGTRTLTPQFDPLSLP